MVDRCAGCNAANVSLLTCDDLDGASGNNKDGVPPVGNPSKHIGWVSEYGHRLKFNDNGIAICPESNQEYLIEKNRVKRIK